MYRNLELLVHSQKYCVTSLLLFWCSYMVINVIPGNVQCNGGLLPEIILLTLCDYIGEPFSVEFFFKSERIYTF